VEPRKEEEEEENLIVCLKIYVSGVLIIWNFLDYSSLFMQFEKN
jgi:hypothetical protein